MEKSIFKSCLFLAVGITATMFYSCKNEDNGVENGKAPTITATNVLSTSSNVAISNVKAEISWDSNDNSNYTIAQAQFKNNGFTLQLPATIAAQYLTPAFDTSSDDLTGITISDKNFQGNSPVFSAYDNNDNELGSLDYAYTDPNGDGTSGVVAAWIYADRDVTIKGEQNYDYDTVDYNLTLKKGWNITYNSMTYSNNQSTGIETYTYSLSSQKPSGVTLQWYFSSVNYTASLKSSKSLSKKMSFFRRLISKTAPTDKLSQQ